jgi:single-strand DNA-binding protein
MQDGEWQEEAHFFDLTAWKELADNVVESLKKGDRVTVVGRLNLDRWEDKNTGDKRSKVAIVADEVSASLRWATARIEKNERDSSSGGGSRGGDRGRDDRSDQRPAGRDSGGRGRSYNDEVPF